MSVSVYLFPRVPCKTAMGYVLAFFDALYDYIIWGSFSSCLVCDDVLST